MAAVSRIADGLAAVAGAGTLSQFPELYQQYLQRLSGRLDQAEQQVRRIQEAAAGQGLSLEDYLSRFLEASDPVYQAEGSVIEASLQDALTLREAQTALSEASLWERPFAFLGHLDPELLSATFDRFVPALPLSAEGLTYAAVGLVAGLASLAGLQHSGGFVLGRWRAFRLRRRSVAK